MAQDKELSKFIKRRLEGLQRGRYNFDSHWQEIVDYILPHRQGITTRNSPGIKRMDKIYDATATHALYLLAAALHGMLTNPANPWFALKPDNPALDGVEEVTIWIQEVERTIYTVLNSTNWNTEIHESYLDICGFGTANLFIGKDPNRLLYFDNRGLGECYIAENHLGQIDTVFRVYTMTARQMVQEWGAENVSEKVAKAFEKDPDEEFGIIHAVYPRTDRNPKKLRRDNLPWASIYVESESENVLDVGGFEEYPYCNPRWSIMSGEVYGRSPGMIALPDVKMVNKLMEIYLRAAQKKLDPPILVPNDGFLNPIRTSPGSINTLKSNGTIVDKLGVFPVPQDIQVGDELIQRVQNSVRMIFYNDMLQLPQGPDMTATEVLQRVEEKLRILGPVMGRFQDELLAPCLSRVFHMLMRMGVLPPPPRIIVGARIKIEYVSPLAKAQRLAQAQGISKAMEFLLPYVQVMPEMIDPVNPDAVSRYIFDVYSAPQKVLRSKREVEQLRQARADAQKQAQASAETMAATEAVPRLAKSAEPNSPLDFFLNQMGQEGGQEGEQPNPAEALAPQGAQGVI